MDVLWIRRPAPDVEQERVKDHQTNSVVASLKASLKALYVLDIPFVAFKSVKHLFIEQQIKS